MTLAHIDIIQLTMVSSEIYNKLEDSLHRSRDLSELDNMLWNDNCDYIDIENCTNLNPNHFNLIVLQLNICSLLSHQQELSQLIRKTEKKNSRIDIILLCETFLSKNTYNMVSVSGFTHLCNYHKTKKRWWSVHISTRGNSIQKKTRSRRFPRRIHRINLYRSKV